MSNTLSFLPKTTKSLQTAITHFLGKAAAYVATVLICLVIIGSALGNSFVAGRMTVAAANAGWLPKFLGSVGRIGGWKVSKSGSKASSASEAVDQGESPMYVKSYDNISPIANGYSFSNALILNTVISAIYILLGNMRILLTLNGLAEYAFFFLTVLGAIILRWREPDLDRPVKPYIIVPAIFAVISGLVVIRGAIFATVQAVVLIAIWMVGLVFYYLRRRSSRRID